MKHIIHFIQTDEQSQVTIATCQPSFYDDLSFIKLTGQIYNRIWISEVLGIGLIYFGFKHKLIHTTLRYYYIQPIGYIVVYFSHQLNIVI